MGLENCFENLDDKRYRSMWKNIQGRLRNTIWTQSPCEIQTPDGIVILIRVI